MKVFLDTNVLVSAVATRGLCADVFREVLTSHDLIISASLLKEARKALQQKIKVPASLVSEFLNLLAQDTILTKPVRLPKVAIKGKSDLIILAAALSGDADLLVTGDRELLDLGSVEGLKIVSPRAFWERLRSQAE